MSEEQSTPSTEQTTVESTEEATTVVVEDNGEAKDTVVTYANGKYKSVSDLEKGYQELQSTFSKKLGAFEGAPENYTVPEGMENDPTVSFITGWGKEHQLSDKGFQELVKGYNEHIAQQTQEYQKAEMAKLGKNATERVRNVSDWINAELGDKAGAINLMAAGAAGIEALEALRNSAKAPMPAAEPAKQAFDKDKLDFMQFQEKDAHGNRRYETDPAFRKKILEMRAQLKG